MDFGTKKPPGLPGSFSQGIGRENSIPSHLLNCPMMNPEHPGDLDVIYEVLIGHRRIEGATLSSNHNICLLPRTFALQAKGAPT
jgi:hypothetical protein